MAAQRQGSIQRYWCLDAYIPQVPAPSTRMCCELLDVPGQSQLEGKGSQRNPTSGTAHKRARHRFGRHPHAMLRMLVSSGVSCLIVEEVAGMAEEIRGQAGTIMCPHCEQTRFDIPHADDPILTCRCGTVLGMLHSLRAYCDDETLTHVTARLKKPS
jgi:hypothetical protein